MRALINISAPSHQQLSRSLSLSPDLCTRCTLPSVLIRSPTLVLGGMWRGGGGCTREAARGERERAASQPARGFRRVSMWWRKEKEGPNHFGKQQMKGCRRFSLSLLLLACVRRFAYMQTARRRHRRMCWATACCMRLTYILRAGDKLTRAAGHSHVSLHLYM